MVCPNCGNFCDGAHFCTQCGAELPGPLAQTGTDSSAITLLGEEARYTASGGLAGRTLDQKYYLESKLGSGGMGTVYRANRLLIGDWVAVKVLHRDQMADPRSVERFHREAKIVARLKHPNVATVYDFGVSSDGLIYLVMDLAGGESLSKLVERQGMLTETDAAEIILQVCAALDEAHRQGVVHRDIKPENILVQTTSDGLQVKVLDFGVASSRDITASRLTRAGALVGTPYYMSPEHCLGEELDERSDIYSLGIVLFEMLTGVVPFDSPTPTAIAIKQVNDPPPPPRALNPNISAAVESVVLRALEKRRDARPQTAGELARDLIAAAGSAGTVSSPSLMASMAPIGAAQEAVAPAPVTTLISPIPPISEEIPASESRSGSAVSLDDTPAFGEAFAKTESSGKLVLPIFVVLILLAIGGLWWYLHKGGNEQAAAASDSAERDQRISIAGGQPATQLWELIPGQTIGVRDAVNSLGAADQQMALIRPGGQLALEYRDGRFLGDGPGADLRVYGPEPGRVSYIIFVKNDSAEAWKRMDINSRGFLRGEARHDMGHHGIRQARQVMIRNNGNTDLRIDAVSVVYKDQLYSQGATGHRH